MFSSIIKPGFGKIVIPNWVGTACELSLINKVLYEKIMKNCKKYERNYERARTTCDSFDILVWYCIQDIIFDEKDFGIVCDFSTKNVNENEYDYFLKYKAKHINFFSDKNEKKIVVLLINLKLH